MKYLIDENLSPELVELFEKEGMSAYHVNQIKSYKKQRITDDQLRRISLDQPIVIVTRDDDFVKSFVDRKVPDKLVYIYGIDDKEALLERIRTCIRTLDLLIKSHDFLELNAMEVRTPFS